MENIFDAQVSQAVVNRIENLTPNTHGAWGKMNVEQMLAHCNVTYEMVYTDKHPRPNKLMAFMLKMLVKNQVVSEKPYKKNSQTAPQFIITDKREFNKEKKRLIDHINKTQELGISHFDGKESHSFGKLSGQEWNNMFYKHVDHHLRQFGV